LGVYFLQQNENRQALANFQKALALKKVVFDTLGLAFTYENLSKVYQKQHAYRKAIGFQIKASELRQETLDTHFDKVKRYYLKAGDSLNLSRLYYHFGAFLSKKGRTRDATVYLEEALRLVRALHNDKGISSVANYLAGEYWDLGEKNLSTSRYKEALSAAVRMNDSNRMAAAYLNIGDNYKELGNLEAGMQQFIKALSIKEKLADSSHLSFYYIKAAEIAKASKNPEKWKFYIQKAYRVRNLDHCATAMEKAIIYDNLGGIAEMENKNKTALRYFDTLMLTSKKIGYTNGIKAALNSRAEIYKNLGQPQKALALLREADRYATENPYYRIRSRNARAGLYLETGDYRQALRLLKQNIASPKLSNYADEKINTFKLLYKVNVKLKNYKEAFRWNDSLRNFEDYVHNKAVRLHIAELETKYETEKSHHTISILKAKNEIYTQQIRFAVLFIVALIVAIVFGIFMARMNKLKAEFRENLLQQKLLRSQMNPHFIFNALASIQQMIQNGQAKEASFYLGKFASIARLVLEYSNEESIPLDKELEVLQSYIELEKLRTGGTFDYQITVPDDLETEFIRIPPMLIQPFVENAIKHGLKEKESGGLLQLTFEDLGDVLKVVVEDNGLGISKSKEQPRQHHRSMAMDIFEKRRQLMQKRFKKKLVIRFIDLNREGQSGTRVIIHIPIL
jgi:tetratricopeptide (TPR) repeat protein